MSKPDLIMEDWWNEGFDDYFSGAPFSEAAEIDDQGSYKWCDGWKAAQEYRMAIERA